MNWFTLILSAVKLLAAVAEMLRSRGLIEQGKSQEREEAMSRVLSSLSKASGIERQLKYATDEEINRHVEEQGWYRD